MYSQCCKLQNIFAGIQIQENSVKFRKIQENSTLCQKPPAGPVCIPSVVNCNFFLQAIIAKSYVSLVVVAVWLRVTYTYHILVHICIPTYSLYTVYTRVYTTPIFMREQARNTGRHLPKVCICTTRGFPVSAVLIIALNNVNSLIQCGLYYDLAVILMKNKMHSKMQ